MVGMAEKILIIDDDTTLLRFLQEYFSDEGYEVHTADRGQEGLREFYNQRPDIVVLDLMMPGMDGAEVLLRKGEDETIRDIPVIALTALNSPFDQIMWLARTDLQDFIVKSKLPRRELIARIERVLQLYPPPSKESPEETV